MNLGIVEIQKNSQIMEKVPKPYCEVFGEEPWNEKLGHEEIIETMHEQFKRPGAIALAALKNNEVIGFAWMYEIFKGDLKDGTRYSPGLGFLFENQKRVFYLQEIGVTKEERQRGVGEALVRQLLEKAKQNGTNTIVLSTHLEAQSMICLISKIGFKDSGIVRPPKELGRTYWILKLED